MATQPETDPDFYLVRYVDYTVDMIALWPKDLPSLRDHVGVKNLHKLPVGEEPLALDRDYIVGVKKIRDLGDDEDDD